MSKISSIPAAREDGQGLYIHIPFCGQRCLYCDFYSTTYGADTRRQYVEALCAELTARSRETAGRPLSTIYLGGGTPSLLSDAELCRIFQTLHSAYSLVRDAEVTIEVNPDDVSEELVQTFLEVGINRVSMGVQSFDDRQLLRLRRRHTSEQAQKAIGLLTDRGITNLSIDLIYGLPGQTLADWEKEVQTALQFPISHLSAYALTYEEGTPLYRLRESGKVQEADEELSRDMYYSLIRRLKAAGFLHYEISNFALPGKISRHNSSYWKGVPYMGCGPGAHSYNGNDCRRWNEANLDAYLQSPGMPPFQTEILSATERKNEKIFTALRTFDGVNLQDFARSFGEAEMYGLIKMSRQYLEQGLLEKTDGHLKLTDSGLFLSDMIMSDLMSV